MAGDRIVQSGRRAAVSRARFLAFFTLVLFASSAVPVLAEPSNENAPPPPSQEAAALPNGVQVAEGLRNAEEREEDELRRLESPKAEAEREASRGAYTDATPAEAEELLTSQFSEQLSLIDQDPARALTDVQLEQVLGPTEARIEVDGKSMLMDGTVPVRARTEDGGLSKVSLALQSEGGAYAPANPLTDVTLPDRISGGISVGDSGLSITPESPEEDSAARRMDNKDLLYVETKSTR